MMDVHVFGAGKLGSALIQAVSQSVNYRLATVISSRKWEGNRNVKVCSPTELLPISSGIIFLCVPDDKIAHVAKILVNSGKVEPECIVAHVSGARSSLELTPFRVYGCPVASFHPMQTFTESASAHDFHGVRCSIEGDNQAVKYLVQFCSDIGAQPVQIDAETKRALHIAGVMVSNFMSSLFLYAGDVLKHDNSELDPNFVRDHYAILTRKTLDNILNSGFPEAITGPASRGDVQTVIRHLEHLPDDKSRLIYKALSHRICEECLPENHPLFQVLK